MRRVLLVVLSLGVVFGFGSSIARAAHYARHHRGGCDSGWQARHWGGADAREARFGGPQRLAPATPAPAPAAAPQTVVVAPAAAAPAAAPNVFIVMPGATAPAAAPMVAAPTVAVPSATPPPVTP